MNAIDRLRPWEPEHNPGQAKLALGAIVGEGVLTLAGVTLAAASGNPDLAAAALTVGSGVMVGTTIAAFQ